MKKNYCFFVLYKNEWKEHIFRRQKNKKSKFYKKKKKKNAAKIDGIDVNKILVLKEEPYATKDSFKYFI